jgi:hypothetical protein
MKQFTDLSEMYKKKVEDAKENVDETHVLEEIRNIENEKLYKIFKKITIIFQVLEDLLKFIIVQVDTDRYQKAYSEKIKFPTNIDQLIIIIGCYGDAFTPDMTEELFRIIEMCSFKELLTISRINIAMIPFVANDKIEIKTLESDYIEFSEVVRNFACSTLNVNIEFEDDFIVECETQSSDVN